MEKKLLRLLIVDDSPDDADLPVTVLRKDGYTVKSQRVQDIAGIRAALDKGNWDVVLAEYTLPHFGALLALDTLKHYRSQLPLIVLTKKISDGNIARVMRAGARDVLLKSDPARLAPVIERELAVIREHNNYHKISELLKEVETKHQAMIDGSREAICYSHEGMHVDANRAYLTMFGYDGLEELEGVPVLNLIDKRDHGKFKEYLRQVGKNSQDGAEPQNFDATRKDGSRLRIEVSLSLIDIGGEKCTQIVVNDVSKRIPHETKVDADSGADSDRDPLTGAYKRDYFLQELAKTIEQAKSSGRNKALLYIELNGLKKINAKLGEFTGDRLLRWISQLFKDKLDDNAVLARFGGDELAVLLQESNPDKAQKIADSLKKSIEDASGSVANHPDAADCTLGLIMIDKTAGSVEKILSLAYGACEQAKKQKKAPLGPVQERSVARAPEESESQRLATWRQRIQRALDHDTFKLVYQPVINLIGDPSEYYEVLIRLPGDDDELISAGEFMPVAEQSGQIHAIDQWVIRHALSGLADLHKDGQKATFFVNLSAHASQNDALLPLIRQTLKDNGLAGRHLVLETDESTFDDNPEQAAEFMRAVEKLGCRLSLDNFGARLATISQLQDLPIEFLKIDGGLVRDAARDNIKQIALKTIVQIAKLLNRKTIGKNVEDEDTLSLLYSYELDYLQGNYFQHAGITPDFSFEGETTLSSDMDTPGWPPAR
ncbi:MAG: EAL domain-containing protein [Acidiferrobacterales bacterium]